MAKLTKAELLEQAPGYFKAYPSVNTFYATSDGMFFTADNRGYATDHQRASKTEMHIIKRYDVEDREPGEETPDMTWTKARLQTAVASAGFEFDEKETKKELLEKLQAPAPAVLNPEPSDEDKAKIEANLKTAE